MKTRIRQLLASIVLWHIKRRIRAHTKLIAALEKKGILSAVMTQIFLEDNPKYRDVQCPISPDYDRLVQEMLGQNQSKDS